MVFFIYLSEIDRPDPTAGRAKFFAGKAVLLQTVLQTVIGHTDCGAVADFQIFRRDGDAGFPQAVDLLDKMLNIDHRSAAKYIDLALLGYAAWQQVQDELALFVHHRVAGIVAPLIAAHNVVVLAEQIDHPPFSLVAPVDPDDCRQHTEHSNPYFSGTNIMPKLTDSSRQQSQMAL